METEIAHDNSVIPAQAGIPLGSKGYSLIEVLVVVAMVVILLRFSLADITGLSQRYTLSQTTAEITTIISDSQHQAQTGASEDGALQSAGVLVEGGRLTQFVTPADYAQRLTARDNQWEWPEQIVCENIALPSACATAGDCVIFTKGTGRPEGSGSFRCRDQNTNQSRTVTISANGLVTEQL